MHHLTPEEPNRTLHLHQYSEAFSSLKDFLCTWPPTHHKQRQNRKGPRLKSLCGHGFGQVPLPLNDLQGREFAPVGWASDAELLYSVPTRDISKHPSKVGTAVNLGGPFYGERTRAEIRMRTQALSSNETKQPMLSAKQGQGC